MIISDLNQFEIIEDANVIGAGGSFYGAKVVWTSKGKGNTALADAGAEAYGKNTFTQTGTGTYVEQGVGSSSGSSSVSSTNGKKYH